MWAIEIVETQTCPAIVTRFAFSRYTGAICFLLCDPCDERVLNAPPWTTGTRRDSSHLKLSLVHNIKPRKLESRATRVRVRLNSRANRIYYFLISSTHHSRVRRPVNIELFFISLISLLSINSASTFSEVFFCQVAFLSIKDRLLSSKKKWRKYFQIWCRLDCWLFI